jgi:hypothetical protein
MGNGTDEHACAAPYNLGSSGTHSEHPVGGGAASADDCFFRTTPGKYVATAGDGEIECLAGYYCQTTIVFKGGGYNTGSIQQCPSNYPDSSAGSQYHIDCYKECLPGEFWQGSTESCMPCTDSNAKGYYCKGTKVHNRDTLNRGLTECTVKPAEAVWSGTGGTEDKCPWQITCAASNYYDGAEVKCKKCPAGYYCPGDNGTSDSNGDIGKNPCPGGMTSLKGERFKKKSNHEVQNPSTKNTCGDNGSTECHGCYMRGGSECSSGDCTAGDDCIGGKKDAGICTIFKDKNGSFFLPDNVYY